jgi:hypothetical protein
MRSSTIAATLAVIALAAAPSAYAADPSVHVVTALYGRPDSGRARDFADRLQTSCGPAANYCEAFCDNRAAGAGSDLLHWPWSGVPACRIVYRCGVDTTRVIEAKDGETIVMRCRD